MITFYTNPLLTMRSWQGTMCTSGEEYKAKESAAHDLHMHLYRDIISELMMIKDKVRFGTREDTLGRVSDLISKLKE